MNYFKKQILRLAVSPHLETSAPATTQSTDLNPVFAAYLETPSLKTKLQRRADSAPPVIFLHGFLGDSRSWASVLTCLSNDDPTRAIDRDTCEPDRVSPRGFSLDLLGFGDSSKPAIRYDIAQEVAFVHQFVTQLNLAPCILVGHSFGGWVAAAYALAYPLEVSGLMLVAPAGIRDDEFCARYNHLRPLLWPSVSVDWLLKVLNPLAVLIGQAEAFKTIRWARQELQAQPAAKSFLLDRLKPEDAIDTVEQQIYGITCPTAIVAAALDTTIPLWHCQTYADRIPSAQLHTLPDAGHDLLQTHDRVIAEWITKFTKKIMPQGDYRDKDNT